MLFKNKYNKNFFGSSYFRKHLQSFSRDFTGNYNLSLLFGGPSRTDGSKIWIDNGEGEGHPHDVRYRMIRSTTLHENLHILYTPFDEWVEFLKKEPNQYIASVKQSFLNIVEDAFDEFSCSVDYPSYYPHLEWSNANISNTIREITGNNLSQYEKLCMHYAIGKRDFSFLVQDQEVLERFEKAKPYCEGIYIHNEEFDHRTDITLELIEIVKDWVDQYKQDPWNNKPDFDMYHPAITPPSGSSSSMPTPTFTPTQLQPDPNAQPIQVPVQGQSQPNDPPNTGDPNASSSDPNQPDPQPVANNPQQLTNDQKQQATKDAKDQANALKQAFDDQQKGNQNMIAQVDNHTAKGTGAVSAKGFETMLISTVTNANHIQKYDNIVSELQISINNLIKEFKSLESENPTYVRNRLIGTKLDMRNIHKREPEKMMARRFREERYDPAILIATDLSGSTDYLKSIFEKVFVLFQEFCNSCKIPLAIIGHNIDSDSRENRIHCIKMFEDRNAEKEDVLGFYSRGNTREDISLLWASNYLSTQSKPDKLMLCLSDGEPMHRLNGELFTGDYAKDELRIVEKTIRNMDIDILGLGVGVDLSEFYSHSIHVDQVEELPKIMVQYMKTKIRGW